MAHVVTAGRPPNPVGAAILALGIRQGERERVVLAMVRDAEARSARLLAPTPPASNLSRPEGTTPAAPVERASASSAGSWASAPVAPCDGDLPPCWRIIGIESGGDWNAHNSTGCVEHGVVYECWGPYQFSGSYAGRFGLPLDLYTTTHDQWVAAARELWNGGAGCSNWSAC